MAGQRLGPDPGRPRVCIVRQIDVYELVLRREAEALLASGYDVDVICMREEGRPRIANIDGVTVVGVRASRAKGGMGRYALDYLRFLVLAAGAVANRHVRHPYVAIQVNTMPDVLVLAALIPKLLGARVFTFMKEPVPELGETLFGPGRLVGVLRHAEQVPLRLSDHIFTVTDQLKERYLAVGAKPEDVTVVLNFPAAVNLRGDRTEVRRGVDGVSDRPFTIVCHGSIEERYGHDTLLLAARIARADIPNLAVIITGRGSALSRMLDLIDELGLGDVATYEGWVSQERLAEILAAADVGVVAQKASPYSHLVHTDKMCDYFVVGLPVIASRLKAVSGTFDDSVVEYFEPGNPEDLAAKMMRLYRDQGRRAELSRNGRRAEMERGWEVQKQRYLDVYRRFCPAGSPADEPDSADG